MRTSRHTPTPTKIGVNNPDNEPQGANITFKTPSKSTEKRSKSNRKEAAVVLSMNIFN